MLRFIWDGVSGDLRVTGEAAGVLSNFLQPRSEGQPEEAACPPGAQRLQTAVCASVRGSVLQRVFLFHFLQFAFAPAESR